MTNRADTTPATSAPDTPSDIIPFNELPLAFPALFRKKGTAAWLLRNRERNGLAAIVHVVGRTAFVSKAEFMAWFRSRPAHARRDPQRA